MSILTAESSVMKNLPAEQDLLQMCARINAEISKHSDLLKATGNLEKRLTQSDAPVELGMETIAKHLKGVGAFLEHNDELGVLIEEAERYFGARLVSVGDRSGVISRVVGIGVYIRFADNDEEKLVQPSSIKFTDV